MVKLTSQIFLNNSCIKTAYIASYIAIDYLDLAIPYIKSQKLIKNALVTMHDISADTGFLLPNPVSLNCL